MTRATKTPAIHAVWNKDMSISLFARGKLVFKADAPGFALQSARAFMIGWFDNENLLQHRVRWTFQKPPAHKA